MNRKLKALGLAIVASLALSAVAASAAQATFPFTAPEGPVTLTGNQATTNVFTTGGGSVSCKTAEFTGTNTAASASSQTITPHYRECTAFGFTAHVDATPCTYEFATPTVKIKAGEYTGAPPKVNCPGAGITITPTFFGASVCTATIGTQTPTAGHVIYNNEGAGTTRDVLVTAKVEGIHYTATGGVCGTGGGATNVDGKYTGSVTLKGFQHNLAHTNAKKESINHRAVLVD